MSSPLSLFLLYLYICNHPYTPFLQVLSDVTSHLGSKISGFVGPLSALLLALLEVARDDDVAHTDAACDALGEKPTRRAARAAFGASSRRD